MNVQISLASLCGLLSIFSQIGRANTMEEFDETKVQEPFTDSNEEDLVSSVCRTRAHMPWDYCSLSYDNGEEKMSRFIFTNWGENRIVPKPGFGIGRDFEFMFEGFARSDLGMLIWDMPDEYTSHGHLKLMMFFPRHVMPAIRYVGDSDKGNLIVTLPTREEVIFDSKSKEIIGGVLDEGPMAQDVEGQALNPAITYTGNGVVMEADRLNDYPVGLDDKGKDNLATIRKKGFKDCLIPAKRLWYTDKEKGENVFFNKSYVTDEAFDAFLIENCQFSMYE
jgi:hypothetical protein